MKERWLELSEDAVKNRAANFDNWLTAENIPFETNEAEAVYKQRVLLIKDAIELLKVPERIPICPSAGHFPIEYSGISWQEARYDYEKLAAAWDRYHIDFPCDVFTGSRGVVPGKVLDLLDFKLYRWAGSSLRDDQEYQFVEDEYMQDSEYQELIDDPTGFFLKIYFPRIFGVFSSFSSLPLLPPVHEIPMVPPAVMPFGDKAIQQAFAKLAEAGDEALQWGKVMNRISAQIMARGYPSFTGGITKAPFDLIGDSLRGTRGIMMDMFRHPDEVIEACDRLVPFMIKAGVGGCRASGHMIPFIPLHKGADGFMSDEQFHKFYWPSLRKVIISLCDAGLVPLLFAEGGYNQRLEAICDLPKGSVIWWFDNTDMSKAKEMVGQVSCIAGNVPLDILCTGTEGDVTQYCKQLIDTAGEGGGFIFSTGAGIQGAKPANVKAMIEFATDYGVYR